MPDPKTKDKPFTEVEPTKLEQLVIETDDPDEPGVVYNTKTKGDILAALADDEDEDPSS